MVAERGDPEGGRVDWGFWMGKDGVQFLVADGAVAGWGFWVMVQAVGGVYGWWCDNGVMADGWWWK